MIKYRLVVADLDGTLLDNDGCVSDYTKEVVDEYHRLGGMFSIATGRMDESTSVFAKALGVKAPVITYNGGKVVNLATGTALYESFLDGEMAKRVYSALREIKKDMVVYYDGLPHITELNDVTRKYLNRINFNAKLIDDIDDINNTSECRDPFSKKILVIDPKREFDLISSIVTEVFGDKYNCVTSDDEYFEILPSKASKGHGLKVIANSLGIPMAEVIAIGDYLNDLSMIEAAGLGVAVRNARDEVLAAADYITSANDEDGVALVIKKVIDNSL